MNNRPPRPAKPDTPSLPGGEMKKTAAVKNKLPRYEMHLFIVLWG